MQRYTIHEEIGKGSFGIVFRATSKESNKVVAIKKLNKRFEEWDDVKNFREFQAIFALSHSCQHINKILEVVREKDDCLYFVCEFMSDGTLNDLITQHSTNGEQINPKWVQSILHQVLLGLNHIHECGFMHRDLKPENLLMHGTDCKVADFSLTRGTKLSHNIQDVMTTYVSTRWYRAPELLLGMSLYTEKVDMFAYGCVMAELLRLDALFPGTGELQQIQLILNLLGPISTDSWPEGMQRLAKLGLQEQPSFPPDLTILQRLHHKVPSDNPNVTALLARLLTLKPNNRPNATTVLEHAYFQTDPSSSDPSDFVTTPPIPNKTRASVTDFSYEEFDLPPTISTGKTSSTPFRNSFQNYSDPTALPMVSTEKKSSIAVDNSRGSRSFVGSFSISSSRKKTKVNHDEASDFWA